MEVHEWVLDPGLRERVTEITKFVIDWKYPNTQLIAKTNMYE